MHTSAERHDYANSNASQRRVLEYHPDSNQADANRCCFFSFNFSMRPRAAVSRKRQARGTNERLWPSANSCLAFHSGDVAPRLYLFRTNTSRPTALCNSHRRVPVRLSHYAELACKFLRARTAIDDRFPTVIRASA